MLNRSHCGWWWWCIGGGGGGGGGRGNQNKRESKIDRRLRTFIDANYRATVWARKQGTGNKTDEFNLKREKIDEDEEEKAEEQLLLISIWAFFDLAYSSAIGRHRLPWKRIPVAMTTRRPRGHTAPSNYDLMIDKALIGFVFRASA